MTNVVTALKNKKPVIANMGPGTFTTQGHYIVLIGYRKVSGVEEICVNDPNKKNAYVGKWFKLSVIKNEGTGFMTF